MKKSLLTFFVFFCALAGSAQDTHYSQFYNSPLTLNPALTGLTRGDFRIGAAYRNQWFSVTNSGFFKSPYSTPSFFFDVPVKIKNDAIGVGALVLADRNGVNGFNSVTAMASVSFIKTLGKQKNHQLSVGVQAGYTYKGIKLQNQKFESQFNGTTFDNTLGSNENFRSNRTGFENLNAGVLWFGRLAKMLGMYAGGSAYNLTMPKNGVLNASKSRVQIRWNVQSGLDILVSSRIHLLPMGLYMRQDMTDELNTGLGMAVDINSHMVATIGLLNRLNDVAIKNQHADALIVYGAYELYGIKIGASYDVTVSKLKKASPSTGAFELTVIYIGKKKAKNNIIFCPMF
jgi:type IX secretion system PorP/SprF family membrane protein